MPLKNAEYTATYLAWDTSNNVGKTGDSANHTVYVTKDGTAAEATNSPAEVDATNSPGLYKITLTAAEMNADSVTIHGTSDTADISLIPSQMATYVKTAYTLASDGLDSISTTEPAGLASNFREILIQLYRRFFGKSTLTSTTLTTYKEDGTTAATTQSVSVSGGTETQGEAS